MLDLILKLIDQCISLIKRKEEVDRSLFADFVKPIQGDFDRVHNNYMVSFKKYRDMMETIEHPASSDSIIFKTISEDSTFSYYDRSRLHLLKRYSDHPLFGKYIREIHGYLILSGDSYPLSGIIRKLEGDPKDILERNLCMNAARYWAIEQIIDAQKEQDLKKEEYKERAIRELDKITLTLQHHYKKVFNEYLNLKDKLLIKI